MIKRFMSFMGGVQVQVTHSLFYLTLVNATMIALTFWSTSGVSLAGEYSPWMRPWHFILILAGVMMTVMLVDYKIVYPYRQAFLNIQATRHKNPAMDLMWKMEAKQLELEAKIDKLQEAIDDNFKHTDSTG